MHSKLFVIKFTNDVCLRNIFHCLVPNMSAMDYKYVFDTLYDNNFDLLKEILNEEIIFEARNGQGFNLLHAAVSVNRYDIIDYILSNFSFPINDRCSEDRTPFFYACESDNTDFNVLKLLIKHGADINLPNKEGTTPLHTSCRNGNTALTKLLLNNNVSITTNENTGYTCLHYIALSNCTNTLNLLINYSKFDMSNELNLIDFDGSTALMLAVDVANFEIAKELVKHGADCDIIGRDTSALHLSIITQQAEMFELLWYKTSFNLILQLKNSNNLIKLLIKYGWFFPDRINMFFLVLDHPKIMDILGEEIKILTVFFYRIRFVKNIHEINIIEIVEKFLQIGVSVSQNDLRVFILNFYRFDNRYEILNILVRKGTANIDEKNIIKFLIELYPKLVPKFLSFCVKNGPLDVISYFTEILRINKDMIKLIILMLLFCTPDFTLKRNLKDHLTNFCYAIINFGEGNDELLILYNYIINCLKYQKVPSLREISRDVIRKNLAQISENSKDYLNIINKLELSKDIVNIIQCTFPVNVLIDF